MEQYVIGIDTGGTFTDGVLMNYHSRHVISTIKTLTTRHDLKEGVIEAIHGLAIPNVAKVRLVGISSTLATNSIAEGKNRKVSLLLIGYDPELISKFDLAHKFGTEKLEYITGGHTAQGAEQAPLDEDAVRRWAQAQKGAVDAVAVSGYFSPLNPEHEQRALNIIRAITGLPVVMGHQLSTKLDSVKRAATAALNASLVAVMQEFIDAVRASLQTHDIHAPLMIVRGDGTLMPYAEAIRKPVETVLSGPAASANGGRFLTDTPDMLVVDMGSTTTDMALLSGGNVVVSEEGARVGDTWTSVEAARIRTLCVGCDSRIRVDRDNVVTIGPEKVTPLARLADQFPKIEKAITGLANIRRSRWKETDIEYWFLYKEPPAETLTEAEAHLVAALRDGPVSQSDLLEVCQVYHPAQLPGAALFRNGVLGAAALTPSDLLHLNGVLDLWNKPVAEQAVEMLCAMRELESGAFVEQTLNRIVEMIVEEIIIFLACQHMRSAEMPPKIDGKWGRWLFDEMIANKSHFLAVHMDSRFPVLGTGAPAEFFIGKAAEYISASFIMPPHFAVANAIGAVSGSVMETVEARVFVQEETGSTIYVVQVGEDVLHFSTWAEAETFAKTDARQRALDAAIEAGATDPHVLMTVKREGGIFRHLARAMGNPSLSEAATQTLAPSPDTTQEKYHVNCR
ncbi:MAG: hydantoinase/oxoprolinase N-terminal domain-containing protein [Candidatus Hydrogenedentota bacterium]